jgi:hypothetical protein
MIDARPIVFPAPVQEMNAAFLEFSVPTEVARSLLPGDSFEVVESAPGTAHAVVAAHEYRRGAWGPANTLELAVRARPAGECDGTTGVFLCDAPVSHQFIREAAKRTLGTPKKLEPVEVETDGADVTFTLAAGQERALTLRLPRVEAEGDPIPVRVLAYSYLDDEPYVMPFEMDVPMGVVDPEAVVVDVGTGWFADMLRALGLPRAPDRCTWGEGLTALFHLATPLAQTDEATRGVAELGPTRYPRCFYPGRRLAEATGVTGVTGATT